MLKESAVTRNDLFNELVKVCSQDKSAHNMMQDAVDVLSKYYQWDVSLRMCDKCLGYYTLHFDGRKISLYHTFDVTLHIPWDLEGILRHGDIRCAEMFVHEIMGHLIELEKGLLNRILYKTIK